MENPNYYAIIPANVRYSDITDGAKLLYGEITALCNKEGYCWATNEYFAALYKKSADTISRWISELTKSQFVYSQIDKELGNQRKLYITPPIGKNAYTLSAKMPIPIGKNADHNNTYNSKEEILLAAEPKITPNSESFDQFHSKYELQFTPAKLDDSKTKLELYFSENDLQKELETTTPISETQFKEILHSFLTRRVEGEYKKQFKSFPAMHADFLVWAKRDIAYQENKKNKEQTPTSSAPLPHRTADQLDKAKLQAAIETYLENPKFTPEQKKELLSRLPTDLSKASTRACSRIEPFLAYISEKSTRFSGVFSKLQGLSEEEIIKLLFWNGFAAPSMTFCNIIDRIPTDPELKKLGGIYAVLKVCLNSTKK
jgi:hypothetical protein